MGLTVFNGWTIGLGAAGGLSAAARRRTAALLAAFGLVLLAMLPALIGGAGLL